MGATGFLRNTIAMLLKYFSNFWKSFEMALVNCKMQMKLKWKNHCRFSANGNGNDDGSSNNIVLTIKDMKLDVITLSAKGNQKQLKLLREGSERSVYWNEYRTKIENKITTIELVFSNHTL